MYQTEENWARGIEDIEYHSGTLANEKPEDDTVYLSPVPDLTYSRRFSTMSAASDDSTRGERRLITPEDSPQPDLRSRSRPSIRIDGTPYSQSETDPVDSSKVQLPSIFSTFDAPFRNDLSRRMSLPNDSLDRSKPPQPTQPPRAYGNSPLSSYTFPPPVDGMERPRLDTQLQQGYGGSSYPTSATTATGYYASPLTPESGNLGAPASTQQLYNGAPRIAGHNDRRLSIPEGSGPVKTEHWSFSQGDYGDSAGTVSLTEAPSVSNPQRSPGLGGNGSPPLASVGALVERPPRKRGKLPKHVTDFLKDWLHRHADHPYPSEEEKKQLCHTTGLSMSQVSNWMINARRRILAPAQRAAAQAANGPYGNRAASQTAGLIDQGRRSSMPTSTMTDSMQLHHPSYLPPALPNYAQDYLPHGQRPMLNIPPRTYGSADYGHRVNYPPMHNPAGHYVPSGMPMSAPPTMSATPFGHGGQYASGQVYAQAPAAPYRHDSAHGRGYYQSPPTGSSPPPGGAGQTGNGYGQP